MSDFIGGLVDASVAVVEVPSGIEGKPMWARVRRLSAGEAIESGLQGLVIPDDEKGQARKLKPLEAQLREARVSQAVVCIACTGLGPAPDKIQACQVVPDENTRVAPGLRALPAYSLPAVTLSSIALEIIRLTIGEGWRQRVGSFLGG